MKKSLAITAVSAVAIIGLFLLAISINKNKAEQQALNALAISSTADIPEFESRSSEWGKYYPRQYDSYMKTKNSDDIDDMLKKQPALVVLWAGYGFSKDYNAPRGRYYMLEDNINTPSRG